MFIIYKKEEGGKGKKERKAYSHPNLAFHHWKCSAMHILPTRNGQKLHSTLLQVYDGANLEFFTGYHSMEIH